MNAMRQTLLFVWKDLRLFARDRLALFFALAFPLIFVAGFSVALGDLSEGNTAIQVVLASEEAPESLSQQIMSTMAADPDHHATVLSPAEARDKVDSGQLDGFILFPDGFSAAVQTGQSAQIRVVGDPNAALTRARLSGLAESIATDISNRQLVATTARALAAQSETTVDSSALEAAIQRATTSAEAEAPPVAIQTERVGDIKATPAASVVLPGYVTMFIFFTAGFAAQQFLDERTNHTMDRLLASGVSGRTILAGKWLGTAARGVVQAAILWIAGVLIFRIDMGEAPLGVVLITLGMLAASASFGLFLAALVKTQRAAIGLVVLCAMALAALGGSWWPLFVMPQWMQQLAKVTPHAWANDAFNRLMIFGASTSDVLMNLTVLVGFAVVLTWAAMIRVRVRA